MITPPPTLETYQEQLPQPVPDLQPEPLPIRPASFWLWRAAIFGVTGMAFFLRLQALASFNFHIDEFYTLAAANYIAESGVPRYPTGLFYDPGLPFTYLTGLLFWGLGFSEALGRWPAVIFGTLSVVTVYWLGRQLLRSPAVGLLAAAWLALSVESIDWSGKARMITLAQWLGLLAIALLWLGLTRDSSRYRLGFALSYGLTLLSHFSMVVLMPAWFVVTALLVGLKTVRLHRRLLNDGLILLVIFGLSITSGVIFQPPPTPDFDIGDPNLSGKVDALGDKFLQFPPDLGHVWEAYGSYFMDWPHGPLLALALVGLGLSLAQFSQGQRQPRHLGALFAGLIFLTVMVTLALIISPHWQRSRYLLMQGQGLFLLLAAHGCRELILRLPWPAWYRSWWQAGAAVAAAIAFSFPFFPPLENILEIGGGWNRYDLAFGHVRDHMAEGDQIMSMHPPASLLYLNQSDYYLVQSSPKLIVRTDGALGDRYSGAVWLGETEQFNEVVATSEQRVWLVTQEFWLFNSYDGYLQQQILWQMDKLWGEGGVWALASRPGAWPLAQEPHILLNSEFEEGTLLLGYTANSLLPVPGSTIHLTLFWQGENIPLGAKVFVHLRDGDNNTLAQADHFIYDNKVPNSRWSELRRNDTVLRDGATLVLPPTLGPGAYRLLAGFYHPETFQRLGVVNDQSGESAVILREWVIQ